MDLVEQLGEQYVSEFFRGALIRRGRILYLIKQAQAGVLVTNYLNLDDEEADWGRKNLPTSTLENFTSLAWPKLGYRNLRNNLVGNAVCFFGSTRSVLRGLREEHLTKEVLPIFDTMGTAVMSKAPCSSSAFRLRQLFNPKWIPFKEGINKIKAGEIVAFALNEDMAVSLSVQDGPDRFCDILYKQKVVGQVSESGEILIANQVMMKSNLKKMYALLEM